MSFTTTVALDGTMTVTCEDCGVSQGFRSEVWRQAWMLRHQCREAAA